MTRQKLEAAAKKVHSGATVEINHGIVEVLLPEGCGFVWEATEGTMLVADAERFGGIGGAIRETMKDVRAGIRPE